MTQNTATASTVMRASAHQVYIHLNQPDIKHCLLGCADNVNCDGDQVCDASHQCGDAPTLAALESVTVRTSSCSGCSSGNVEEGLKLHLLGRYGPECTTDNLDNSDRHDYGSNAVAMFNATLMGGNDDHGLGGCNNVS